VLFIEKFLFPPRGWWGGRSSILYFEEAETKNTLFRVVRDDEEKPVETVAVYEEMEM
jgi:hypothetical protein